MEDFSLHVKVLSISFYDDFSDNLCHFRPTSISRYKLHLLQDASCITINLDKYTVKCKTGLPCSHQDIIPCVLRVLLAFPLFFFRHKIKYFTL